MKIKERKNVRQIMTVLPNGREAAANAIKGCGPQPSDLCRILEAVDAPLSTRKENKVSTTKTPEKTISHRFIFPAAFLMVTNVLGYFSTFSPLCPCFFLLWLLFFTLWNKGTSYKTQEVYFQI